MTGAVFAASCFMLLRSAAHYDAAGSAYEAARSAAAPPVTKNSESSVPVASDCEVSVPSLPNLTPLREVNPHVVGWISIPGTEISYPLLQGDDNGYYLTHLWDGTVNSCGSIFIDSENSRGLTDFNTVIYGHNMKNGSMFAPLKHYKAREYFDEHREIHISYGESLLIYEIFAAYEADVKGNIYTFNFASEDERKRFLKTCSANSVVDGQIQPSASDRIITLSTCTGSGHSTRWVVQAVLKDALFYGKG